MAGSQQDIGSLSIIKATDKPWKTGPGTKEVTSTLGILGGMINGINKFDTVIVYSESAS